jgi:DNA-binding beta-propeller fold protein YncE
MNRCIRTALLVAGLAALLNQTVLAASISNSLWLGNDSYVENNATLYNVDRAGTVLHSFPNLSMTGVAIDPTTSSIYFSAPRSSGPSSGDFSGIIKRYDLNSLVNGVTPVPNGTVPGGDHPYEDMAFNPLDPNHLWRANYNNHTYDRIDLTTGGVTQFASPLGSGGTPMGMAWDGTQFWVSDAVSRGIYTMTAGGVFSASPVFTTGFLTGGIAWDSTDATLWIGGYSVHHYTTGGIELGTPFASPGGRFVDGLEFQAVPEPSTLALLGFGLAGFAGIAWRRCRQQKPRANK